MDEVFINNSYKSHPSLSNLKSCLFLYVYLLVSLHYIRYIIEIPLGLLQECKVPLPTKT